MNASTVSAVEMLSLARVVASDDWSATKMPEIKDIATNFGIVFKGKSYNRNQLIEVVKAKAKEIIAESEEESEEVIKEEEEAIEEVNDDSESVSSIESTESELPTAMEVAKPPMVLPTASPVRQLVSVRGGVRHYKEVTPVPMEATPVPMEATPVPMEVIEHIDEGIAAAFDGDDKEIAKEFMDLLSKDHQLTLCRQYVRAVKLARQAEAMLRDIKLREAETKLRETKKEIQRLRSIPSTAAAVNTVTVSAEKPKLNAYQEFQKNPKLNELIKKTKPSLTQNEIVSEKARLWGLKKKNPELTEEELINM